MQPSAAEEGAGEVLREVGAAAVEAGTAGGVEVHIPADNRIGLAQAHRRLVPTLRLSLLYQPQLQRVMSSKLPRVQARPRWRI